ncbi:MAG: hypothetical protein J4F31_00630 [Flavobacteriales bacterium]|nr:hypothetical protein [Flavobacteriales bacterium]
MNQRISRISFSLIMADTNEVIAKHKAFWLAVFALYYIPLSFVQWITSDYTQAISEVLMTMDLESMSRVSQEYRLDAWINIFAALIGLAFFAVNSWAIFRFWGGQEVKTDELFRVAGKKWLPLFGTAFLVGILLIVPLLLFILPGLFLAVCWSMSLYFVLFLDLKYVDAITASYRMIIDKWWTVFLLFLSVFLMALFSGVVMGLLFFRTPAVVGYAAGNIVTRYFNIFLVVAFLHIYNYSYPPVEEDTDLSSTEEGADFLT